MIILAHVVVVALLLALLAAVLSTPEGRNDAIGCAVVVALVALAITVGWAISTVGTYWRGTP